MRVVIRCSIESIDHGSPQYSESPPGSTHPPHPPDRRISRSDKRQTSGQLTRIFRSMPREYPSRLRRSAKQFWGPCGPQFRISMASRSIVLESTVGGDTSSHTIGRRSFVERILEHLARSDRTIGASLGCDNHWASCKVGNPILGSALQTDRKIATSSYRERHRPFDRGSHAGSRGSPSQHQEAMRGETVGHTVRWYHPARPRSESSSRRIAKVAFHRYLRSIHGES